MSLFRNLHALKPYSVEDHPTVMTDKLRAFFAAPTQAEKNGPVAVSKVVYDEPMTPEIHAESSVTSAYVDQYIPLPLLHGDQPLHG